MTKQNSVSQSAGEGLPLAMPETTPRLKLALELWWRGEKRPSASEITTLQLLIVIVGLVLIVLVLAVVGAADQVVPLLQNWPLIP